MKNARNKIDGYSGPKMGYEPRGRNTNNHRKECKFKTGKKREKGRSHERRNADADGLWNLVDFQTKASKEIEGI